MEWASQEMKGDRELCMAAVAQSWIAVEYASEEMKNDESIVVAAVRGSRLQDNNPDHFTEKQLRDVCGVYCMHNGDSECEVEVRDMNASNVSNISKTLTCSPFVFPHIWFLGQYYPTCLRSVAFIVN